MTRMIDKIERFIENETDVWLNSHRGRNSRTHNFRILMLVDKLGYKNLTEFFTDNSGAMDTVLQWIAKQFKYETNFHLEGAEGAKRLGVLVGALGYTDVEAFLEDNQGVVEALINWVAKAGVDEWEEALEDYADEE